MAISRPLAPVETGVPIPTGQERTGLTSSLRQLAAGESFTVEKDRRSALSTAIVREQARNGQRFTTRLTSDGRVRAWRVS